MPETTTTTPVVGKSLRAGTKTGDSAKAGNRPRTIAEKNAAEAANAAPEGDDEVESDEAWETEV
jgi:hypothetical protein